MDLTEEKSESIISKSTIQDSNILIVFGITLTSIMGVTSISPAFPKIIQKFGISDETIGLLVVVFTIPSVILTPILGIFADRFGRKRIIIPSLFLFGTTGFACAFAKDFYQLLIFRFLQGIGAASLGTLNITIISDLYSGQNRVKVMGYNGAVTSIGTASFPIIGGALALIDWNFPFFLPIIAIPIGVIVIFLLKNPEPKAERILKKYLSNVFKNMENQQIIALFICSLIVFISLYGAILTFFPILVDKSYNIPPFIIKASSFEIGVIISSLSIASGVISGLLGKLTKFYETKTLIKFAFLLYGLSLIIIPIVPELWIYLIPFLIFGIAQGINVPSIQTLIADLSPMEQRAIFMSFNGMFLFLGQTIGPIVMGIYFGLWGLAAPFIVGAIFFWVMLLFLLVLLK